MFCSYVWNCISRRLHKTIKVRVRDTNYQTLSCNNNTRRIPQIKLSRSSRLPRIFKLTSFSTMHNCTFDIKTWRSHCRAHFLHYHIVYCKILKCGIVFWQGLAHEPEPFSANFISKIIFRKHSPSCNVPMTYGGYHWLNMGSRDHYQ